MYGNINTIIGRITCNRKLKIHVHNPIPTPFVVMYTISAYFVQFVLTFMDNNCIHL